MDALKALASQQGCSADGTAATRNPLSQFMNQLGGTGQGPLARGPAGPRAFNEGPVNDIDRGMSAGMGLQQGFQGPDVRSMPNFVHEFQQMKAGPSGPLIAGPGPRGPMGMTTPYGGDDWVNQFEQMKFGGPQYGPNPALQAAYRESFGMNGPRPMGQRWAGQLAARPMGPNAMDQIWQRKAEVQARDAASWAEQMAGPKEPPSADAWAKEVQESTNQELRQDADIHDAEAMRRATEELVNIMSSDPKFQQSNFFREMAKVASGESVISENEIRPSTINKNLDSVWEDSAEKAWEGASGVTEADLQSAWDNPKDVQAIFEKAYQDELDGKPVDFEKVFRDAFGEQSHMLDEAWGESSYKFTPLAEQPYEMQSNNPYGAESNPFQIGLELFKRGELMQAILAFEAAIEKDPSHAEAWRMLGVTHQESDQDRKAIQCLERAVEQDPYNLDALLGLGVSYVNELDQARALKNLQAWVKNNPKFHGVEVQQDIYGDGSTDLMHDVMMLMTKVEEYAPHDPEVQEVLGVLYNVSRDYERAAKAFRGALNHKPDDYSLWNKLGATLANSNRSEEALPIYARALELKPRYARGWLNFGISHSNLGDYKKAIRAYLRALDLNPQAGHIWNYLRICLASIDGYAHLIPEVDAKNIEAFRAAFDF